MILEERLKRTQYHWILGLVEWKKPCKSNVWDTIHTLKPDEIMALRQQQMTIQQKAWPTRLFYWLFNRAGYAEHYYQLRAYDQWKASLPQENPMLPSSNVPQQRLSPSDKTHDASPHLEQELPRDHATPDHLDETQSQERHVSPEVAFVSLSSTVLVDEDSTPELDIAAIPQALSHETTPLHPLVHQIQERLKRPVPEGTLTDDQFTQLGISCAEIRYFKAHKFVESGDELYVNLHQALLHYKKQAINKPAWSNLWYPGWKPVQLSLLRHYFAALIDVMFIIQHNKSAFDAHMTASVKSSIIACVANMIKDLPSCHEIARFYRAVTDPHYLPGRAIAPPPTIKQGADQSSEPPSTERPSPIQAASTSTSLPNQSLSIQPWMSPLLSLLEIECPVDGVLLFSHVKKAYFTKAVLVHPDKNPSPTAKEEFTKLQSAYEKLKAAFNEDRIPDQLVGDGLSHALSKLWRDFAEYQQEQGALSRKVNELTQRVAEYDRAVDKYCREVDKYCREVDELQRLSDAQDRQLAYITHCLDQRDALQQGRAEMGTTRSLIHLLKREYSFAKQFVAPPTDANHSTTGHVLAGKVPLLQLEMTQQSQDLPPHQIQGRTSGLIKEGDAVMTETIMDSSSTHASADASGQKKSDKKGVATPALSSQFAQHGVFHKQVNAEQLSAATAGSAGLTRH